MKCFTFTLLLLLFVEIRAQEEKLSKGGSDLQENRDDQGKSSGKRWIDDYQNNQSYQPQQTLSKELPTLNDHSDAKNQDRAKQEKTFKDFIGYEAIQSVLINALKPKPIVDTAEESEKSAPNEGSGVQILGDLVVKGSETLSRVLNTVVDKPRNAITRLSASATQALNQLGAYLIGL